MPPKLKRAGEGDAGDDARKRPSISSATAKSVAIAAPGVVASVKTGITTKSSATSKPGAVRGAPKPGIRKVGIATMTSRARVGSTGSPLAKKEAPAPIVTKNVLMWFRNDLRVRDNKALHAASLRAKMGDRRNVVGLYIISESEWTSHDDAPLKIDFWLRNLAALKIVLAELNIPLVVKTAVAKTDVIGIVEAVVKDMDISHVFWNADYLVDEMKRDNLVKSAITKHPGVYTEECQDQCIVSPREIKSKTGAAFTDFVAFHNAWCTLVETEPHFLKIVDAPQANAVEAKQFYADIFRASISALYPHSLDREQMEQLYPAGEEAARNCLDEFIKHKIKDYHKLRDDLKDPGCSALDPYVSNGIISTRQCVTAARAENGGKIFVGNAGIRAWIKDLAWKEFYKSIAFAFPKVCKYKPFEKITENIRWSYDEHKFAMWCQGKTGYPIVDAGMRQLNATGYMHHRVRIIAACFLAKDLMVHWQKGEKYFMHNLIDGEFAPNNGGWQWCASTGAGAQPYYRIPSPLAQSQKFDPNGDYIRRWVPELTGLSEKFIHDPYHTLSAKDFGKLSYPKPIVEHTEVVKKKFTEEFKRATGKA
ncbi:deoxyribodipyrimidine photo-lyase [Entomortierella parvispora]|uniref:Deoxyribodipyrimidine photo-lyase n=1 Tax=Entomortierella parvispora TaxID=205924 RepID=A0A9P3M1E9_9FUNG|nr:deoxyribodipyrimidine photo-lyase [Entomortierella parvispora]